jgi:hypothetical protein
LKPAIKNDKEIPKEENRFEKKVKKKTKRKLEISSETMSKKKAVYRSREAQQSRKDSKTIRNATH